MVNMTVLHLTPLLELADDPNDRTALSGPDALTLIRRGQVARVRTEGDARDLLANLGMEDDEIAARFSVARGGDGRGTRDGGLFSDGSTDKGSTTT